MYANFPEVKRRSNRTRLHKHGSHFLQNTYLDLGGHNMCPKILKTFLDFFFFFFVHIFQKSEFRILVGSKQ